MHSSKGRLGVGVATIAPDAARLLVALSIATGIVAVGAACSGRLTSEETDSGTTNSGSGGASSGGASSSGVGSSSSAGSSTGGGSVSGAGPSGSSGSSGGSSGGTSFDAGGACDSSLPFLSSDSGGGLYCSYQDGPDGGSLTCGYGQQCCLAPLFNGAQVAPDQCVDFGGVCPDPVEGGTTQGPRTIECHQIADCRASGNAGATACCAQGPMSCYANYTCAGGPPGMCSFPRYHGGTAVVCEGTDGGAATACASGELQVCGGDVDCPSGKHCVAGKWIYYDIGFCQ